MMSRETLKLLAREVILAHVSSLNDADVRSLRAQLVGSAREDPFQAYIKRMAELTPLAVEILDVDEPSYVPSGPFPRFTVWVKFELRSGEQCEVDLMPVWIAEETGLAQIAGRFIMRKRQGAHS